jgi:outer membrane protein OmpA-like peptidoglycan-associated protein
MQVNALAAEPRPTNCDVSLPMDVPFPFQTTEIQKPKEEQLAAYIEQIKKANFCPLSAVVIVGHADSIEDSPQEVIRLARKRAANIAQFLQYGGIPNDLIYTDFKGATQPLVTKPSPQNARVEITVVGGCPHENCEIFPMAADGFRHPRNQHETKDQ